MRKYQIIWNQIKNTGECTIAANPALHKRLKKAVTKEKYNDTAYKLQWDIATEGTGVSQPQLSIQHPRDARTGVVNRNALRFVLIKPLTLGDL